MTPLSIKDERQQSHTDHVSHSATEEGLVQIARILRATITQLRHLETQLNCGDTTPPNAAERSTGRDIAEGVIDNIDSDLPVCPADLVGAFDPNEQIIDDEIVVDEVRQNIKRVLRSLQYR